MHTILFPLDAQARFWRDRCGMAATEFAIILPVIVMLFFGMVEASDTLSAKRRVANAANALVDLVGQATEVDAAQLNDIFTGVERMIDDNGQTTIDMKITSVIRDPTDADRIIVHWSRDKIGGSPYAQGAAFDKLDNAAVLKSNMSVLHVEITYDFMSSFTQSVNGGVVTLRKDVTRLPRRSARVTFCPDGNPGNCIS